MPTLKTRMSPLDTKARNAQASAMEMGMRRLEAERKVFEKKYGHQPSDAELMKFRTTG